MTTNFTLPISKAATLIGHGQLLGIMLYPDNEEARARFVRRYDALAIAKTAAGREGAGREEEIVEAETAEAFAEIMHDPWLKRRLFALTIAGLILRRVFELAHSDPARATMRQAIGDIVKMHKDDAQLAPGAHPMKCPAGTKITKTNLWDIWARWKRVAHLGLAWVDWRDDQRTDGGQSAIDPLRGPESLRRFLDVAEGYRVQGAHHVPPLADRFGKARPVLDPKTTVKARFRGSRRHPHH